MALLRLASVALAVAVCCGHESPASISPAAARREAQQAQGRHGATVTTRRTRTLAAPLAAPAQGHWLRDVLKMTVFTLPPLSVRGDSHVPLRPLPPLGAPFAFCGSRSLWSWRLAQDPGGVPAPCVVCHVLR